ncbi:hypothetical protein [Bacillus thuringiensis]|uniref:hypothetical protein n=1 Tax=Bacillus thuringiensis TaxID=1428 RepID=UPI001C54DFC0|nr:hypothetical protein [Bacillus thuringiensis]
MKIGFTQPNQYSESTSQKFIDTNVLVKSAITSIETQYEYVDKQRKETTRGYKLRFVRKGLNSFAFKFDKNSGLSSMLSIIESENLQEIERYHNQSLNRALVMNEESIYTISFSVEVQEDRFLCVSHTPAEIIISIGKGTGLLQVINNEDPYQVLPLLLSTFYTERGIL